MDILLNDIEVRVLGSLMEKSMTTPEYYPLSLNALTNACNQKSNREPVVAFDDTTVIRDDYVDDDGLRGNCGRAPQRQSSAVVVVRNRHPKRGGVIDDIACV